MQHPRCSPFAHTARPCTHPLQVDDIMPIFSSNFGFEEHKLAGDGKKRVLPTEERRELRRAEAQRAADKAKAAAAEEAAAAKKTAAAAKATTKEQKKKRQKAKKEEAAKSSAMEVEVRVSVARACGLLVHLLLLVSTPHPPHLSFHPCRCPPPPGPSAPRLSRRRWRSRHRVATRATRRTTARRRTATRCVGARGCVWCAGEAQQQQLTPTHHPTAGLRRVRRL